MSKEARELAQRFGVRMCDENGMTHGEELYCLGLDDIIAMKEALAKQEQEVDWKDMYEKEKRRSAMWIAKYEKDIGPLEYAVPAKQEQSEPVAWLHTDGSISFIQGCGYDKPLYTTPQPVTESHKRKPLTQEQIDSIPLKNLNKYNTTVAKKYLVRTVEAMHNIKE